MNGRWSDESLHAYVDGELAPADAAALLEALAADDALRERVAQLRLTKELMRHAYADVHPGTPRRAASPRLRAWRPAAVAAAFVAGAGLGWLAHEALRVGERGGAPALTQAPAVQAEAGRVVLHVSADPAGQGLAALERAQGLIDAARASGQPVHIEIVANGPGLDLLREAVSPHAQRIAALRDAHAALTLVACGQTVSKLRDAGADVRLLPGTVVATSALDQIVLRLQQGWAYVRI